VFRDVFLPIQPKVFCFAQGFASQGHQRPVLLLADLVHPLVHLLHDMELVEDDFILAQWQLFKDGLDIGLPHVHRDYLDGS